MLRSLLIIFLLLLNSSMVAAETLKDARDKLIVLRDILAPLTVQEVLSQHLDTEVHRTTLTTGLYQANGIIQSSTTTTTVKTSSVWLDDVFVNSTLAVVRTKYSEIPDMLLNAIQYIIDALVNET